MKADWFETDLLRAHPLWIPPDWAIEGDPPFRLDAREWIGRCRAAGIRSLLFVTKQHDGRCVFTTSFDAPGIGRWYPGDFLGDICREARAADISIVAYYSSAIDTAQADRHPDWRFIDADGRASQAYGYTWVCLNSPYGAFALDQIGEILAGYDVQCIWLDILALGRPRQDCLCPHCQRAYTEKHGGDLRAIVGTPAMGRWKIDCLEEHLSAIRDLRDRHRPAALISFNGAGPGFRRHPEAGLEGKRLLKYVDFCSDEGHYPARESSYSRYLRRLGKPFEILAGNGVGSEWVNFSFKPSSLLTLEAAIVCAQGGKFGTGISVLAGGEMPQGEVSTIGETVTWLEERRPYFTGQEILTDVAILCQPYRWGQRQAPYRPAEAPPPAPNPEGRARRFQPLPPNALSGGLEVALVEDHWQIDLIDEDQPFAGVAGPYRLLVLPNESVITADLADRVRAYVAAGGNLLVEGHASLLDEEDRPRPDFLLADVLGINFDGYVEAWDAAYIYLDDPALAIGMPEAPVLADGPALRIRPHGAEVLARLGLPVGGLRTPERHMGGRLNPPGASTAHPAITLNRYGQGTAMYIAAGIGGYIAERRNMDPWAKRLVGNMAKRLVAAPLLITDAPAGIELLVARQGDHNLLYLFNHYQVHESMGASRQGPQVGGFTVTFDESHIGAITAAWSEPEHTPVPLHRDGTHVTFTPPPFAIASIIAFDRD